MKKKVLYTLIGGFTALSLTSCGTFFSIGGGIGGPMASSGAVYDDGYNVEYGSSYGRLSYEDARREAFFLSDKMAYELGLTDAQYEAVYEINLDYLLNMQGESSLYGSYWSRRNSDLFYVLNARQYNHYIGEDYFYRPVYWYNQNYAYRVYNRYTDRDRFYRSRPADYFTYRGGRNQSAESYYAGRFGDRQGRPPMTSRSRTGREVYQNDRAWDAPRQDNRHYSFGNASRNSTDVASDRHSNQSFGGSRQQTTSPVYQPRQSTVPTLQQPDSNNGVSFGNASRPSATSSPMPAEQARSTQTRPNMPNNYGSFGGHR